MPARSEARGKKREKAAQSKPSLAAPSRKLLNQMLCEQMQSVITVLSGNFLSDLQSRCTDGKKTQFLGVGLQRKEATTLISKVLEEAFVKTFMLKGDSTRCNRARLSLLLSTAEILSFDDDDSPVLPQIFASAESLPAKAFRKAPDEIMHEKVDDDIELTSEEAAKLLHVSRTHLNTLIRDGRLTGVRLTPGGHRRISRAKVLAYKVSTEESQRQGLDEMVQASARMGLYDAELKNSPRRKRSP
ncbi:hypothetical protein BTHE68_39880 [Burkholderia sp. THE68]|uniref:helix-turn-helix domain-containing protein n=1 Tax=Burkholderia sp. THE68 TaxID=758782 RepID=UPI00131880EE|nr:helix-turn-helix domain-containing protein [Burkholderia sp. THE68]BBU30254.1 hypothetical protein BTHE68_39880 [Burkholderia sp. THE68]